MRRLIILSLLVILIGGCTSKETSSLNNQEENNNTIEEENTQEEKYVDENPLKISLYYKENGVYNKKNLFKSKLESFKDIGLFSIILDDKESVSGNSIKSLYQEYSSNYEDFEKYKIGYNVNFTLTDGTTYNETILKPLDVFDYPFSDYLYIWLYDDINNSGHYSHLEVDDYNEKTVMSSIKLMATGLSKEIDGNIKITVFTYDTLDDFLDNEYRGNSKFTMEIAKE